MVTDLFLAIVSQVWTVSSCKCKLKKIKSCTHLDCLKIDPWFLQQVSESVLKTQHNLELSEIFSDSLDSLQ
ncbi:unnamed protein product [Auanema sp. JU1783]|nr:unnamed protein product [Auanema sp. JU1783]